MYAINGERVTAPDEEVWAPIESGVALDGRTFRSPYWQLTWRKTVADSCRLDWFNYDNQHLSSLTTRPPGALASFTTYVNAICQSVSMRQRLGVGNEITATFLVRIE